MAKLMWQHGEEALAKALVASNLYRAMAIEAADDDLEVEVSDELRKYAAEFDREAFDLLDFCYRQDDDLAQQLLTCELSNWSRQTCLKLAFACHHRELLAHPCSQLILGDIWLGGLRTRHSTNLKIAIAVLCPPLIVRLEFKSKEELQLMPQTEEERMTELKDELDSAIGAVVNSTSTPSPSISSHSERIINKMKRIGSLKHAENVDGDDTSNAPNVSIQPMDSLQFDKLEEGSAGRDQMQYDANEFLRSMPSNRQRQLRFTRKLYEFYTAPITKFWSWTMAYFFFLIVYTYTLLIRTLPTPEWNEYFVIVHMASLGGEQLREIMASEPVKLSRKLAVWGSNFWNCCDAFFVAEFFVGMLIRLHEETLDVGRVLYCLNIVYW